MTQNILDAWEQQDSAPLPRRWRERVRVRVQAFKQAAERRIDEWLGSLDDAQTRADRDF